MDISKDADELNQYVAQTEKDLGVERRAPDISREERKRVVWSLSSDVKAWLARLSTASQRPFRFNVLVSGDGLRVGIGRETVQITVHDGGAVQADDLLTSESRTVEGPPYLEGIKPVLMGAIKRSLVNP